MSSDCVRNKQTLWYIAMRMQTAVTAWFSSGQILLFVFVGMQMQNALNAYSFNLLITKLFNCNFHPLEVVSRWRDPQLQVSKNYSNLTKLMLTKQILLINVTFYLYQV